jgi:multidrug efflux pump subunit AcrB
MLISHFDGDRSITVYADIDTKKNTSKQVNKLIKDKFSPKIEKHPDMRLVFGGEEQDTQEAMKSLFIAMGLALLGIYFILVILFDSFSQPFLVMMAIPFGFAGIIFAFFIHNIPLGFMALIGFLGLTGVVVNDSLVMISFLNNSIKDNAELSIEKLAVAARYRLRPIMLTTATTAAGLFPMAYGFGGKSPITTPMMLAIAWGLIFATVITLILIPVLFLVNIKVMRYCEKRIGILQQLLIKRNH